MQIVIDIPKHIYEHAKEKSEDSNDEWDAMRAIANGTLLPRCNQCRYYEGVHNVQGHAPCKFHGSGGVLWHWYCSQFKLGDTNNEDDV